MSYGCETGHGLVVGGGSEVVARWWWQRAAPCCDPAHCATYFGGRKNQGRPASRMNAFVPSEAAARYLLLPLASSQGARPAARRVHPKCPFKNRLRWLAGNYLQPGEFFLPSCRLLKPDQTEVERGGCRPGLILKPPQAGGFFWAGSGHWFRNIFSTNFRIIWIQNTSPAPPQNHGPT
jgi:hypothetical protein